MEKYSKEVRLAVFGQIVNMVYNNLECGYSPDGESFQGWCEDGGVFYNMMDDIDMSNEDAEKFAKDCTSLMEEMCDDVDNILFKYIWEKNH